MEGITIRTATLADLETLLTFERGIITAERPFDQTLNDAPINYYNIAAMIAAPHIEVVVAETGNEIIGSGYARIEDAKTLPEAPAICLPRFYVCETGISRQRRKSTGDKKVAEMVYRAGHQ
jgi:hypothetical protein